MVSVQQFKRRQQQQKRQQQQNAKMAKEMDEKAGNVSEIKVLKEIKVCPEGKQVKSGQIIDCHYVGTLVNGQKFDSSRDRNEPFQFTVDQKELIQGWSMAVKTMREGERKVFQIPYRLAYGEQGIPGAIPPRSDLIFDLEVLHIVDAEYTVKELKQKLQEQQEQEQKDN